MVGGRLLQTGAPRELYEHPAKLSVARFLGRNNLIQVMRLSSSNERTGEFKTLQGGHTLRMSIQPGELAPLNKPCTLAIRPEHVLLRQAPDGQDNALPVEVREIDFAGATSTVKLDAAGLLLEALVLQPNSFAVGARCAAVLPAEHISLLKE